MCENISIDLSHAPFNKNYLQRILHVINNAVAEHPRTLAIRIDLHLPEYRDMGDSISCNPNLSQGLMSRFIESLNARIGPLLNSKIKEGKRTYPSTLRYAWVRETGEDGKPHYHTVLFVNNDTFNSLGLYCNKGIGLASLIQAAWLSALGLLGMPNYQTLIHFPTNPLYYLDANTMDYQLIYNQLTFRLSYFAKERTKVYSSVERSFGCSQR
ncbi:inovirus Gp2 family protein [Yersinia enterocolitica]